ncbi:MAG: four helix bundle protein [Komarekiella atlantica HA4396-MV6]|nr:four helix bundle protein [Komarekiella atlantica HA4396-MV6]
MLKEQFSWQRQVKLAINCYSLSEEFLKSQYGLTSQIRRLLGNSLTAKMISS